MDVLKGSWKNDKASVMDLIPHSNGTFTGTYTTAVSRKGESLEARVFSGTYQEFAHGVLCAFTAQWSYEKDGEPKWSTTSWSGQIWDTDLDHLVTTWILTSAVDKKEESWGSVTTNKDIFRKTSVSEREARILEAGGTPCISDEKLIAYVHKKYEEVLRE